MNHSQLREKSEELQRRLMKAKVKYEVIEFYETSFRTGKPVEPFAKTFKLETTDGRDARITIDPNGLVIHVGDVAMFTAKTFKAEGQGTVARLAFQGKGMLTASRRVIQED